MRFLPDRDFRNRTTRRLTVFGQMLLGVAHTRGTLSYPLLSAFVGSPGNVSAASNAFVWQPGAGADVSLSRRWALRLEVDYRLTSVVGSPGRVAFRQPRFSSGIVFKH